MNERPSLREPPPKTGFKKGAVFVLFGELFDRGYASGLVAEARDAGMEIFGMTTGRRGENNALRPLTPEELSAAEANLGGRIVNVPLMSGFEFDAPEGGPTPRDLIGKLSMANWREHTFDADYLAQCQELGAQRFKQAARLAMSQLSALIPAGRDVLFAHTMAGGVVKTKIFLALAARIYKGRGARFLSSAEFLDSDMGRLILQNFEEVTANTFACLIEESAEIREKITRDGGRVRYCAYGYHGSEILIDGRYQWQSYVNYTQGYAKMKLERIAAEHWAQGVCAVAFNCPEIRTNSSDIFTGVELPLHALLLALKKEKRRRLGAGAMASVSGSVGRGDAGRGFGEDRNAVRHAGRRQGPRLRAVSDAQRSRPRRDRDRDLGSHRGPAQKPQRFDRRLSQRACRQGERVVDIPGDGRPVRAGPLAQPRHHRSPAQRGGALRAHIDMPCMPMF